MSYDYKKEYNLWKQWKDNEEKILRKHNVDEKIISDLRKFDMAQFNAERSFKRHQNVTKDIFFIVYSLTIMLTYDYNLFFGTGQHRFAKKSENPSQPLPVLFSIYFTLLF